MAAPKRSPKPPAKKKAPAKTVKKKAAAHASKFSWKLAVASVLLVLLSPFYYGYVLKMFSATWQWILDIGGNPHYRTYKSFGIPIPEGYSVHGIDVSYAQGKIDWQKVSAMHEDSVHVSFAFVKATEGLLTVDPYFKRNWREGPKAGITCGAYHFFRANKNGLWQARFFLQNVKFEQGDLPPVVDVETLDHTDPAVMRKELKAFLTRIQAGTGVKPIIYTGLSFYNSYLDGYFDGYKLWIAHYYQEKLQVGSKTNWMFWQHSDIAHINGIGHTVDMDVFRGDSLSFRQQLVN